MDKETNKLNKDNWITYPVRLLSLEGACQYLSCSSDTLEQLIALGSFPVIRLTPDPGPGKRDRRKRWLDRADVDRWIDGRKERHE